MGDQPFRLLYASHSFPPPGRPLANIGGMQRVATELYDTFKSRPDVHVAELVLRTSWRWTHVRTVPFLAKLLFKIPRLARQQNIDIVLFSSMVTASVAACLPQRLRERDVLLAAISHGRDVTLPVDLYQQFVPSVFDALDLVLPVSQATAAACRERGLSPSKCRVVPNGVKPTRFRRSSAGDIDDNIGVDERLILCSVGRQVERKGFTWFVRNVMPELPEHVHYYLAGNGPEHETIQQIAREQKVDHRVHLLGKIPEEELIALYHAADLYIMPNIPVSGDMEGFGVVMLEAGICGLPTIAARLEGIQDVIADGRNGHLLEPRDGEAFTEQIRYYVDHPQALAEASRRTEAFTRNSFSWTAVAEQYLAAFRQLKDDKLKVES